jgi:hypothetical protein
MTDEAKDKKPIAAYVPFKTFLNALESLEHGVPHVIDRSVWPTFSGLYQSQTLAAFRFLGLIDEEGKPTADLLKLVGDKDNRKLQLRRVLEQSYASVVKRDLTKMTSASLDSAMEEYGGTGDTHRKAISFFLQAARYAELPLSPWIMKQARTVSTRKRRSSAKAKLKPDQVSGIKITEDDEQPGGPTKRIALRNGVYLSLAASTDVFKMDAEDRQFVLKLLEEMEAHEAKTAASQKGEGT